MLLRPSRQRLFLVPHHYKCFQPFAKPVVKNASSHIFSTMIIKQLYLHYVVF